LTRIRTVATHEIVSATFPRPAATERDELARALGRAIDTALGWFSFEAGRGRRPGIERASERGRAELSELCRDADLHPTVAERAELDREIEGVVRAFRGSPLYGLERPRSRLLLIDESVGVYAQPDYWDRASAFYEMKSYKASPPPPDLLLQIAFFHLAFPGFKGVLAGFDRHADPVTVHLAELPPPSEEERDRILGNAEAFGRAHGVEKVLEYVDVPVVRYRLPPGSPPTDPAPS
jgi:hypothetical protein